MTAHCAGYRLNLTRSEPLGLYKIVSEAPSRGDLASFCFSPENEYKDLTADRNYLGTSLLCPSGQKPLLKEVVGVDGDSLTVKFSSMKVNDTIFILTSRAHDSNGRKLPHELRSGTIPGSKALLLSTHHKNSFDSRYFGLVDVMALRKVIPVFTFN
ncbi:conjugative transfer signal peptidase TraF [Halodesulfovibrio aestuarii]|uniref:conjugative transfer signal peptidase TraF n=1 Tax=Halodesulfovibrio aestuarii TaxID=126333 RepID=UPI000933D51B|nr:conjugative transfer signal peptidase TraF [Halodesulfovibrio aestuarii]